MLADVVTISFISLSAIIRQTNFYWAFVVNFIFSFSIGFSSGLDIIKFQHSSKPWPLAVIAPRPLSL
jgi:NhaP-type Na+/H+ and K+/H+ antiporter